MSNYIISLIAGQGSELHLISTLSTGKLHTYLVVISTFLNKILFEARIGESLQVPEKKSIMKFIEHSLSDYCILFFFCVFFFNCPLHVLEV